jgi:hypothetical protein
LQNSLSLSLKKENTEFQKSNNAIVCHDPDYLRSTPIKNYYFAKKVFPTSKKSKIQNFKNRTTPACSPTLITFGQPLQKTIILQKRLSLSPKKGKYKISKN